MDKATVILSAAGAALFMVTLAKDGISPDLRAAVRTTLVVILGWGFACLRYGFKTWSDLIWQVRLMLTLSVLVIILAWFLHFRVSQKQVATRAATMDYANVGFAILFAILFLLQQTTEQSAFMGFILVCGSLILAFGKR